MWRTMLRLAAYVVVGAIVLLAAILFTNLEETVADRRGDLQWAEARLQRVLAAPVQYEYRQASARRYAEQARRELRWAQIRMIALPILGYGLFVVLPIEMIRGYPRGLTSSR